MVPWVPNQKQAAAIGMRRSRTNGRTRPKRPRGLARQTSRRSAPTAHKASARPATTLTPLLTHTRFAQRVGSGRNAASTVQRKMHRGITVAARRAAKILLRRIALDVVERL